jgi:hypothetical protein
MSSHQNDANYRRAVNEIAANCPGLPARDLIDADPARFPPAKVRSLANKSPEYQRHVVGRAAAGDANPFRPTAATLLVYDTVAFREVVSRLHRAAGLVRREADLVDVAVRSGHPSRESQRSIQDPPRHDGPGADKRSGAIR